MDTSNAPKEPGCYLFKDKDGNIIYVGKSKNIYRRVRQYFSKIHDPSNKLYLLARQAVEAEYRVTASELDALILECLLIKQYKPWFNSQLKHTARHPFLRLDISEDYPTLCSVYEKDDDTALYYGVFYKEDDLQCLIT
jgi:excinuclease ABC subunit C